ncbi:MAG: M48 family metalloprotease [Steroidobacteraceae bacterium]
MMLRILLTLLVAASLTFGTVAGAQSAGNDLPDIGSPADATITRSDEYQIGRMIVRGLREQGQILDDPEVNDYVQTLGSRIVAQAQDVGQPFQFFVVRDPSINAFALPGGFVGVNAGLLTATANEAQLASVLAHEIAHVTQRHIARSVRAQGRQSLASAAAILAAILIGATTGSADAAQAGIAIAQGTALQQRINFTRANEYEADRIGIGFLAAAGFDPFAMPDFFETLGRRSGLAGSMVPEFLQTHPVTSNRIAESRDRAGKIVRHVQPESPAYQYVRERVRVLGASPETDLRHYYATLREGRPLTPGQQYGEALARLRAGERDAAAGTLIELSAARDQGSPMLEAALGQALMAAGRQEQALETFRKALTIAPRNVPLSVRYAEALMQTGQAKQAHAVLLDVFNNVAPTPEQIRLTALAASSAGDTGDAYYYMSEYHIASGDLPLAGKQLELALAAPDLTPVQRARFSARLKEIRDVLAENARGRWRSREAAGDAGMM